MARSGKVRVDITADASGVKRGARDAERSLDRLNRAGSRSLRGLGRAGIAAGAAVGAGLAASLVVGTREMLDWERQAAQTEAVIKSTGGAANVTAKELDKQTQALQDMSGVGDTTIRQGQNLLLTFKNIRNEVGAGNDVYNQATVAALDMSVALDQDMKSSAIQLGKALNDPIRGVTALQRVGVSFTDSQKATIASLVESGRTMDAQKLILKELNSEFGGTAKAVGDSLPGQIERAKRTFEDFSETIAREVVPRLLQVVEWVKRNWPQIERTTREVFEEIVRVAKIAMAWYEKNIAPTIESIVRNARRFWKLFGDDITRIFGFVIRQIERSLRIIKATIELVLAVIRGDWGEAWKALRTIAQETLGGLVDWLRTIPRAFASIGLKMGKALADGIVDGLGSIRSRIEDKLGIPGFLRGSGVDIVQRIFARGGTVPGRPGQAVPITAHAGEVVLNAQQQRMLGTDRIMSALRATGGIIGGDGASLATGGFVYPLAARGRVIGTPYAGTHSLGNWQSDLAYDLAAPAGTRVVSPVSGTVSRIQGSASQGGRFGGLGVYITGAGGQYFLKHLGSANVAVGSSVAAGQTIGTIGNYYGASNHVHFAAATRAALEGAVKGAVGSVAAGVRTVAGHSDNKSEPSMPRRVLGLIGKAAFKALRTDVPDVSSGSAPSFSGPQSRLVSAAGRAARSAARSAGRPPEEVARAGDEAERNAEVAILKRQIRKAGGALDRLQGLKARTWRQFTTLGRRKVGRRNRAAKRRAMNLYRVKLREIDEEMSETREEIAQLNERLREIGEEAEQARYEASLQTEAAAADASETTPAEAGISADQAAQLAQAEAQATTARRGQAISDSALRVLFGSGTIDPGAGSVTVNINTLHPGDPAIQGEVARWVVGALGGQGSVPATSFAI